VGRRWLLAAAPLRRPYGEIVHGLVLASAIPVSVRFTCCTVTSVAGFESFREQGTGDLPSSVALPPAVADVLRATEARGQFPAPNEPGRPRRTIPAGAS